MSKEYIQAYQQAQEAVSPVRKVIMLYDGMIRFVLAARQAIEMHDIEERFTQLSKATKILVALRSYLDFDKGGEIADMLDHYYVQLEQKLLNIQVTNSTTSCDEVVAILSKMKEAWVEIEYQQSKFSKSTDQF